MHRTSQNPPLVSIPTASERLGMLNLGMALLLFASYAVSADEPFRPEAGKFPPVEMALAYRGEVVFY